MAASKTSADIRITDGQLDWSGGVDSGRPTTIQAPSNPKGVRRDMLAWLDNATVRGGGISPRVGWNLLQRFDRDLFQGGVIYESPSGLPQLIVSIAGRILLVHIESDNSIVDLSAASGLTNPASIEKAYFCQGEIFLVIQAGDYGQGGLFVAGTTDALGNTLPLIFDGVTLRRSKGITNRAAAPGTPGVNEIPAATAMAYYMGRLWYTQGRNYGAGDIVGGNSGTAAYSFRDAILNVTESPLVLGGDGFSVPTQAGNIRALSYTANLNTQLGQGPLYVFTREQIYSLVVPVTRADWIRATSTNTPQQTVSQIRFGATSDRSIAHSNGDLYYQTMEPGIRSLILAIRDYDQFGNTGISRNMRRVLQFNDRSLLHMASGIEFDNRIWQTALPVATPAGVAHKALAILDFDITSTFQEKLAGSAPPPAWEGIYEPGLVLQLFEGDFGGLQRAFAIMLSTQSGDLQLWEATNFQKFDFGDKRVKWIIETPAYNWGNSFLFKELDTAELWIDKLFGTVDVLVEFRPDSDPCWHRWTAFKQCAARNASEAAGLQTQPDVVYPEADYCEQDRIPITLPKAPAYDCNDAQQRPVNKGYQFQLRFTFQGWCRLRGLLVHALPLGRRPYDGLTCAPGPAAALTNEMTPDTFPNLAP